VPEPSSLICAELDPAATGTAATSATVAAAEAAAGAAAGAAATATTTTTTTSTATSVPSVSGRKEAVVAPTSESHPPEKTVQAFAKEALKLLGQTGNRGCRADWLDARVQAEDPSLWFEAKNYWPQESFKTITEWILCHCSKPSPVERGVNTKTKVVMLRLKPSHHN